ncbi:MAG: LLM class flavin-dependent oxidoreductase, partial [Acetobacteraceae bacterium]|nr:LLM class flavin-dependent oxidoreductase [Acetobacteraceae bacterium]
YYGGYSPNPIVFLAAAAQRTRRARLVTGAVLPAFNNPLKLAGELAMLDALCDGRLDIGFARAFLPHEFARFGVGRTKAAPASTKEWNRSGCFGAGERDLRGAVS